MELVKLEIIGHFMFLFMLCSGPCFVNSSRDLALNKSATQSSTYNYGTDYYDASRAVDGVLGRDVGGGHCSHTGLGHNQAWWKVDLGQIYRIQTINITYRYSQTVRLKGYSLYVTNETDMTHADGSISEPSGHLCYHDTERGAPTYNQSRQCHVSGRYVVFYNTRLHGDAYVELCGVQVYGCGAGKFGFNCSDTCHCATGGCNPDTGQCDVQGCQTGWMGLSCSLRCHCKPGGACNINTGACNEGCQTGWSGSSCFVGPRDLAHSKPTRQSSTNDNDRRKFGSGKAVDGIITADVINGGSCSHTNPSENHPNAYWQVDLEEVKRIHTINIVYRQLYLYRMSGFYLYISNNSYTNPQSLSRDYLCYHDHGPGLPSYIQSIPCHVNGRYVIFYNKRPADYEPRNVMHYSETTTVIELCEVQVLGACSYGKFGQGCSQNCHCVASDCNKETGMCGPPGCSAGWKGTTCSQECDNGTFGQHCSQHCHCAKLDCNKKTGRCTGGCLAGWQGDSCSQACSNGTYGQGCSMNCHCATSDCNKQTGRCGPQGCKAGWTGTTCNQACDNGTFGQHCSQQCHCLKPDCDKQSGRCTGRCLAGWQGDSCNQACSNGTYGQDCSMNCHCATSDCNKQTGRCEHQGCTAGWTGTTCSQECSFGHFGLNCSEVCHCQKEGCNHINGKCNHVGCQAGWSGLACNIQCVNNTFGRDCNQTCHCASYHCNGTDGVCSVPGCTEGWMGNTCGQECVNSTFGRDCNQTCHCARSDCDRESGMCIIPGCTKGWHGDTCSQECTSGYFGLNCSEMCHCQREGCDHINGRCSYVGCQVGWSGQACDQRCVNDTFGRDCNHTCHCAVSGCDSTRGTCHKPGCTEGWHGDTCSKALQEKASDSSPGSSALVGGVVAAVVAVFIVIVIVVVVVRKRRIPSKDRPVADNFIPPDNHTGTKGENVYVNIAKKETKKKKPYEVKTPKVIETDIDEDEVIYVNGPNDEDVRGETKLLVPDLKETVKAKHENDMYEVEFKSLPHGLKHPHTNAKLEQNLLRNRFKTTFPYDHSRVVLKKEKKGSTDYINANYIDGVRDKKTYIATQGPKTMTLEEFWRMAWQNNCGKIVMLANLVEVGKVKCATYWTGSEGNPLELGLFQVTLQEEVAYAFYTTRKLVVKNKQTNSTRQISQYHFTRWPDHGVPEPFELLQFYKRVKRDRTNHKGPLIVHCSAGIGRTGTFIGLDALLLEGNTSGEIDVFAYTEKMRKDRMNMIQTADQYAMLHDVLLEGLTIVTSSMSKTDFSRAVNDMCDKDKPEQQYSLLDSARPEYSTTEYGTAIENKEKNRNQSILAVKKYTIRLMTTATGYINAVNIPGYIIPYGYILTQHPLDNTVIDFLSLISQERSDTVVSIGRLQNNPCWPTKQGSVAKFGNFVVTNVHCDHHAFGPKRVEERQLTIVNKEIGADTKISLLETPSWGRSMPNSSFMLELIQIIQSRRGIDAPPVIITCSDGATESGLLCTLCNVMERLVVDGDVDIMAAARQLQIRRPQCFLNKDQYVFCYNLVKEHLEESSVYANV